MRRYLFEGFVLSVTDITLRSVKPTFLPYAWLLIAVVITTEILCLPRIRKYCEVFGKSGGQKRMWWSYLVVGLIGAIWLCVYWLVIQGTFAFIASTRNGPDQSTLSSTSLKHDDAAPSSMASQQKETQAQPLSEQRAKKPIPQTTGGGPAIPKRPQVSIEQHSEGPASPNTAIVGDNNQVTVNPPSNPLAPVIYYEFNGAKHTQTGNKFVAEAGEPFAKFQEMLDLEKNGKWVELQKEAESQIQSVPIWLTPYLFLAEARAHQGDTAKAIELCNFIKKRSGGNEQFDRPANNLLAQLAPKP